MSLKVLHVYRTYFPDPPGGVQEVIKQISESTLLYGVDSHVFTLSPNPQPPILYREESSVFRSRSWAAPSSCDIGSYDSFIRFRQQVQWADVVNYHFPWPFADLLHLLSDVNKPTVLTYHSDIIRQRFLGKLYYPLMKRMLRDMSAVVATSPTYAESSKVLKTLVPLNKLQTIPLGIADYKDKIIDSFSESIYLKKHSILNSQFILALGVMRYYKGFHILIQASSSIKGFIVIAGSGPEELNLKKLVDDAGVKNIIFTGQVTDEEKLILLKNCTVFVLPSHLRSEAFGMVLIEASMFSKPMITCEIGSGTSFVNLNGDTGFVVPPESPTLLAQAANKLLLDKNLSLKMGYSARKRYEQYFSANALGQSYFDLYNNVIQSHNS